MSVMLSRSAGGGGGGGIPLDVRVMQIQRTLCRAVFTDFYKKEMKVCQDSEQQQKNAICVIK